MTILIREDRYTTRRRVTANTVYSRTYWRTRMMVREQILFRVPVAEGFRMFSLNPGYIVTSIYPDPGYHSVPSSTIVKLTDEGLLIDGEDIFGRKSYQVFGGDGRDPFELVSTERVIGRNQLPDEFVSEPERGWFAYAHSIESMQGNGGARFKIPKWVEGVAIGLSHRYVPNNGTYAHIPYGLLFTGGKVKILTDGREITTFDSSDEFTLELYGSRHYVLKNGAIIDSVRSPYSSRLRWWLCAALHRDKDRVVDAELFTNKGAAADMTLPALRLSGGAVPTRDGAYMILPSLQLRAATSEAPWGASLVLPAMRMRGDTSTAQRMKMRALLPRLRMKGRAAPTVVQPAFARMFFPAMAIQARGTKPLTARIPLRPLVMKGGSRLAVGGILNLPKMALFGLAQPRPTTQYVFEFLGGQPELDAGAIRIQLIQEGLQIATLAANLRVLLLQLEEQLALSTELSSQLSLTLSIHEYLTLQDNWPRNNKLRDTWVVNINTGASTTYSGYDFNSFCERDGEYFAANDQGIHRLSGDTDNGEKIRAAIQFGDVDLSRSSFKGISECYIGVKTSGQLVLRVVAHGKEYFYESQRLSELMREHRFVTGKGLRANYLTLELYNKDGVDFELDKVEFRAVHKTRRV